MNTCICGHDETEHETLAYRGDKDRRCFADGKTCPCRRFYAESNRRYMVIAYMPSGSTSCMGHRMDEWSSEFIYRRSLTYDEAVDVLADCYRHNMTPKAFGTWDEIIVCIDTDAPEWTEGAPPMYHDAMDEARRRYHAGVARDYAKDATEAWEAERAREVQERATLLALQEKYKNR